MDAGENNLNNILQQTRRDRTLYRQGSSSEMKIEFMKVIRVGTHDCQSMPSQLFHCLGGFWLTLQIVRFQCIPFVSGYTIRISNVDFNDFFYKTSQFEIDPETQCTRVKTTSIS